MVTDVDQEKRPEDLLPLLAQMDIILAEGYKRALLPKIEVFRPETGKKAACQGDPHLIALVSDASLDWGFPVLQRRIRMAWLNTFCSIAVFKP